MDFYDYACRPFLPAFQKGAVADFNGDGRVDLVIASRYHGVKVFRNTRTANGDTATVTFTLDTPNLLSDTGALFLDAKDVLVGDLNGDRKPDLLLVSEAFTAFENDKGERIFLNTTSYNPAVTSNPNTPLSFSEASETQIPPTSDQSQGGFVFDYDNDGDNDLFIYHRGSGQKLYKNLTDPPALVKPPAPCLSCGGNRDPGGTR